MIVDCAVSYTDPVLGLWVHGWSSDFAYLLSVGLSFLDGKYTWVEITPGVCMISIESDPVLHHPKEFV